MSDRFEYVKRGYNPLAVDEYIETLETVLKSYKEKDSAIKNAILNAQLAADNIIQNARLRSDEIKETSAKQLQELTDSISYHKQNLKDFKGEYNGLLTKYLHSVNENEFQAIDTKILNLEETLKRYTARDVAGDVPAPPPVPEIPNNFEIFE